MMQRTSSMGAVMVGVVLMFAGSTSSAARILTDDDLRFYSGGEDKFCVLPITDPAGTNCDVCLSDGNGGSVKCIYNAVDETYKYVKQQSPAQLWSYDYIKCPSGAGTAIIYKDKSCTTYKMTTYCGRSYHKMTYKGTAPGVPCNG